MRKRLSIRQMILLVLLVVIVVLMGAMAMIGDWSIRRLTEHDIQVADQAVRKLLEENYSLSRSILSRYGENQVAMTARSIAAQVALVLKDRPGITREQIRQDPLLRKLCTTRINTPEGQAGYVDLYDIHGVSVIHPNPKVEGRNFSEWRRQYPRMFELVQRSFTRKEVSGYYTFTNADNEKRKKFMVLRRIPDTPYIVSASVVIDRYFLPVHVTLRNEGRKIADQARATIRTSAAALSAKIKLHTLAWCLGLLLVSFLLGLLLSGSIVRPVRNLARIARRLGRGDFSVRVPASGPREIVDLARSFNLMQEELIRHIERVKAETASRQALESEMHVAREIQKALLPQSFPAFPEHGEFDLYAVNGAAREVAGDFYDFFFVTPDTLALVIADVSGKGVPAALFMAVTRTLFRVLCGSCPVDPGQALTAINRALAENNRRCMFVTALLVYYDIRTGRFRYGNGGHDNPLVISAGGSPRPLDNPGDVILAVDPDRTYTTLEDDLAPGELLFLYTDGVTEAVDRHGQFFGFDRMQSILHDHAAESPQHICTTLLDTLDRFQEGERFDDITLMCLKRHHP